jgi:hypothetical protein
MASDCLATKPDRVLLCDHGGQPVNLPKRKKHRLMKIIIFVASYMLSAASLHAQTVKQLQAEIVSLQTLVNAQQAQITSLKNSTVQALAPYVSVSQAVQNGVVGPNITFTGANIHIVDGTNLTNFTNGTGNLLIGYDEPPTTQVGYTPLPPGGRLGSHNLIVGRYHQFPVGFGNVIVGEGNIAKYAAEFVAGTGNTASGYTASVLGGWGNTASGITSVVCGGQGNTASGQYSLELGGVNNQELGTNAITLGGTGNSDNIQSLNAVNLY